MIVEVTGAGSGQTAIRVDAQVTWLPARTPGETIPGGATTVTLSLTQGMNARNGGRSTAATVLKIAGLKWNL